MSHKRMVSLLESLKRVVGEDHERCQDGEHWNDKENKCKQFNGNVWRATNMAHKAGKKALATGHHADVAHAKKMHSQAAGELGKAGFHHLAAMHAQASTGHSEHMKAAADYHDRRGH